MTRKALHLIYLLVGWTALGLGLVGAFLPIMPTVPFLIVSLWGFSKSSERFHNWLYTHKTYGPILRDWDKHRVIPIWGKIWGCLAMVGSLLIMIFLVKIPVYMAWIAGAIFLAVGIYIVSKPSRRPNGAMDNRPERQSKTL